MDSYSLYVAGILRYRVLCGLTGFNIAEAVNFATLRWVPRGLKAKVIKRPTLICMLVSVVLN